MNSENDVILWIFSKWAWGSQAFKSLNDVWLKVLISRKASEGGWQLAAVYSPPSSCGTKSSFLRRNFTASTTALCQKLWKQARDIISKYMYNWSNNNTVGLIDINRWLHLTTAEQTFFNCFQNIYQFHLTILFKYWPRRHISTNFEDWNFWICSLVTVELGRN